MKYRIAIELLVAMIAFTQTLAAGVDVSWKTYRSRPDSWFQSENGRQIAANVLSWQSARGSWPKNIDTYTVPCDKAPDQLAGTFDNGATTDQMRFLARAFQAAGDRRYARAFLKALSHILHAQYPTGGWPQYDPPSTKYHRYITFNDGVMVRLMQLLRDIATRPEYAFVPSDTRRQAQQSFDRGIACILKCQIRVNGILTVWCAQHDEHTFAPRPGRSYELTSLSGGESRGILQLLMSLDNPSDQVIAAVIAGINWYDRSKITGWRLVTQDGDRRIVKDDKAPAIWARFYEIQTNRPLFANRDGKRLYDFNQIDPERRNGYSWLGDWGKSLPTEYRQWRQKWSRRIRSLQDSIPQPDAAK